MQSHLAYQFIKMCVLIRHIACDSLIKIYVDKCRLFRDIIQNIAVLLAYIGYFTFFLDPLLGALGPILSK